MIASLRAVVISLGVVAVLLSDNWEFWPFGKEHLVSPAKEISDMSWGIDDVG